MDENKRQKILTVLKKKGKAYLREISRETGIPLTTVYFYLENYMKDEVKIERLGTDKKAIITIYTLK